MLWCLKYIGIWLTPFRLLYGGTCWAKVPKNGKIGFLVAHWNEAILGGKVVEFFAFPFAKFKFFRNFLIAEKTEKFLPILLREIFYPDFWIPGKLLSGILVQHAINCFLTSYGLSFLSNKEISEKIEFGKWKC